MSDPTDIKALDEYLKRNSEVSQRYRELGADDVPPELDRRVLAAAREAVADERANRSRSWMRWSASVALAASVVLVVTVVVENGVLNDMTAVKPVAEPELRKLAHDNVEAQRQQQIVPVVPLPSPPALHADIPPVAEPRVTDVRQFHDSVPPPQVAMEREAPAASLAASPPAAAPPEQQPLEERMVAARKSIERDEADAYSSGEVEDTAVTSSNRARRATGRAGSHAAAPASGSVSGLTSESRSLRSDPSDPQAWLEDIRELRRAGKTEDADHEWQLFRAAFPDFHVADDDLARKKQ